MSHPTLPANVSAEQQALWQKLAEFSFDADSAAKPFSARLAAENGWSAEYTGRVLTEYRRFLFLCSVAGHVVCPSTDVDLAWHQHLTYSRSYWVDLCQQILQRPLHHDPTAGGPAEARKHWGLYQQTLASYRRIFGEDPPRDIWPLAFERFDPSSQPRQVDLRDHWVISKPFWWPRRIRNRKKLAVALVPMVAVGLGPLDWTGPSFLTLFFSLFAVAIVSAVILRHWNRDVPVNDDHELTPEEVACLSFGRPAVVNATVAGMLHQQQLVSVPAKNWFGGTNGAAIAFKRGHVVPAAREKLATTIYREVEQSKKTLAELQASLMAETEEVNEQLRSSGYLLTSSQAWSARFISVLPLLALLILGIAKIVIGSSRGRPVEVLILGCLFVFLSMLVVFATFRRSVAGDQMLRSLKSQHGDLKTITTSSVCGSSEVAMCAALFGATALQSSVFSDLKSAWQSTATNGGGGGGSSSGCGGGGGGCGGGCGGGGCGGCGG